MEKRILLISSIVFFAAVCELHAQDLTDITPTQYKFSERAAGEKLEMSYEAKWNTPPLSSAEIENMAPNGGLVSANLPGKLEEYQNAICIVDLGGDVGKVLAINGGGNVNAVYKAQGIAEIKGMPEGAVTSMQANFYTNPQSTPASAYIRTEIVMNAFADPLSATGAVIDNCYNMTSANNVTPNNDNYTAENKVYSVDFCLLDDDGEPELDDDENYIYDPTRWLTYTYDCRAGSGNDGLSTAVKMKLWTGNNLNNAVLFFKAINFYVISNYSQDQLILKTRKKEFAKLTPDPSKVASAIKTVRAAKVLTTNGNELHTDAPAEIFRLDGTKVADLKANGNIRLIPGIYVARVGNTSVKFVLK